MSACTYEIHSFVDRDMIMRFLGGGIGHRLASYTMEDTELPEPAVDEIANADGDGDHGETPENVHIDTEAIVEERNALDPDEDDYTAQPTAEEGLADGEEDYGYEHHSEDEEDEEDNRDVDEDDLGPEDGEDAGVEDWEGDEGYAQL